jgi:NAD(P)-dependent dehydrogenase (short-subunit alcohol dehydrogenase family)
VSPVALVTGASRGVGAATARILAGRGRDVVVNYRSKKRRAEEVAKEIQALGVRALTVRADLTDPDETEAMFAEVRERFGRLDLLVLNASGGLERDRSADYAMEINLTAQTRAADLALPLMPEGGRVLFITSHLAHFHGEKPGYSGYDPVAESKKAGEDALRARVPEMAARGVKLVVVSGDIIEGTITPRLLERQSPGLIEGRRRQAGRLPTVEDFAQAIAAAADDPDLKSGATIFVGETG